MGLGGGGLGGGGLVANRAAMRQRTRQQYRTMARMERRRGAFQGRQQQQAPAEGAPAAPAPAEQADYTDQLEKLAKLRDEGVITADDFEAKKKQLLGI
jgi:hypothetical protein